MPECSDTAISPRRTSEQRAASLRLSHRPRCRAVRENRLLTRAGKGDSPQSLILRVDHHRRRQKPTDVDEDVEPVEERLLLLSIALSAVVELIGAEGRDVGFDASCPSGHQEEADDQQHPLPGIGMRSVVHTDPGDHGTHRQKHETAEIDDN